VCLVDCEFCLLALLSEKNRLNKRRDNDLYCRLCQGRKGNKYRPVPPHLNEFQAIQWVASSKRVPNPNVLVVDCFDRAGSRIPSGAFEIATGLRVEESLFEKK
jgi:hypothetical protein